MKKKQALEKMKEAIKNRDTEQAHYDADVILCDFLSELGHGDLVKLYEDVDKWFA